MKNIIQKIKGVIFYDLGFLEKRFYWKTKNKLSSYYQTHYDEPPKKNKTIIYMLDGRAYSGGLSDIIRGILSMFKFSMENGYDFQVNFNYPYDLNDYLVPNTYNWAVSAKDLSYNSNYSIPLFMYCVHSKYGKTSGFESEYQIKLLKRFIAKNENKSQFHIYTNSNWTTGGEYSLMFNKLFKPSVKVQEILDLHHSKLGDEFVSMTFRFQQLLGDFANNDSYDQELLPLLEGLKGNASTDQSEYQLRALLGDFKSKVISEPLDNERDKYELIARCIKKIEEIHAANFPAMKILITADSEIFLAEVSKLSFVYVISGCKSMKEEISDEISKRFLKPYIDLLMLSNAKKLYLLCSAPMYRSGFAKGASLINNREYEEIIF